jgi:cytochrome c oxidase subunit 2
MRPRAWLILLGFLGAIATACGTSEQPQNSLRPEGPEAQQLDNLFRPVFWIAVAVFFLVNGLILAIVVRFRDRGDADERIAPPQVHGNTRLEIGWTILPAALLAVISFFTVATVLDINRQPEGDDVLQVTVVGHQWWWEYQYPDSGVVTANELHIPVDTRVNLRLLSDDVIHSFWPPKLAGKVDVIPGRVNYMTIEASEAKRYAGQCAEYCGLSHANMRLVVVAHERPDFEEWLSDQHEAATTPSDGEAAEGAALFIQRGCGGCHTVDGVDAAQGRIGPNLTHLQDRETFAGAIFDLDERNLRRWLRDPPAMKPMDPDNIAGMPDLGLSEEDITKLIAYLETLD